MHFARVEAVPHKAVPLQFAVAKKQIALGVLRDVGLVRHEYNCQSLFVIQRLKNFHDLDRGAAVEVPGWFVGKQNRRPVHQTAGNGHALLLPAGELRRVMPGAVGESYTGERFHGPLGPLIGTDACVDRGQFHILKGRCPRQQIELLEHKSQFSVPNARQLRFRHPRNVDAV